MLARDEEVLLKNHLPAWKEVGSGCGLGSAVWGLGLRGLGV